MGGNEAGGTRHFELGSYLVKCDHHFSVVGSTISYLTGKAPEGGKSSTSNGINLYRAYTYPALHRSYLHRVFSFTSFMVSSFFLGLRVKDVDLIWGTSPPLFQGFPAWLLAKIKRIPFVLEVRDLWPAFAVDMGLLRNPLLIRIAEWAERFLYHQADHLIVNSPAYQAHLKGKGAPNSKISLVSNGVDLSYFPPAASGEAFAREHQLEDCFVVLYAGAHGPANDLGILLEAAGKLTSHPDIVFVLVGDGKSKPDLIAEADQHKLSNVKFLPPQPKSSMAEVLASADVCLAILKDIPMFRTTYPNKVFDYMAAGKPTLLGIDGVIRDVINASGGGVFIPPGNPEALAEAVLSLKNNPQQCREMGQSARLYVERHFNRNAQGRQLENLFKDIILGESE